MSDTLTEVAPVRIPRERGMYYYLLDVGTDGSFEVYAEAREPWPLDGNVIPGAWKRDERRTGRWRLVPEPAEVEYRRIIVAADDDYYGIRDYAPVAAAEFAGIGPDVLARYDRQKDRTFHCPHCGKRYRQTTSFGTHLWREHNDTGGELHVGSRDFYRRHGSGHCGHYGTQAKA